MRYAFLRPELLSFPSLAISLFPMPLPYQLERLILCRFRQFRHLDLDLRDPDSGEALSEICLLGVNGTGKSTVLQVLREATLLDGTARMGGSDSLVLAKLRDGDAAAWRALSSTKELWFAEAIEETECFARLEEHPLALGEFAAGLGDHRLPEAPGFPSADSAFVSPEISLLGALPAPGFEDFLDGLARDRAVAYRDFAMREENLERPVAEVDAAFRESRPDELVALREIWDRVLRPAGLRFDPEQTAFHLAATSEAIPFGHLSPGMRRFLLWLGQVFCQYFRKSGGPGLLFLDEPENGLHPELVSHLTALQRSILGERDTQVFVATHSPLVAAQFTPEARRVLVFEDEGKVGVRNGTAPAGSDVTTLLNLDFGMEEPEDSDEGEEECASAATEEETEAAPPPSEGDELSSLIAEVMTMRQG